MVTICSTLVNIQTHTHTSTHTDSIWPGWFLRDELSEVSRNRQLTVQFLRADFAAISEVSGNILRWVLEIGVLFVFVCTFLEIAVYRPVTRRFFSAEYRQSSEPTKHQLCYLCTQLVNMICCTIIKLSNWFTWRAHCYCLTDRWCEGQD